MLEFKNSSVFGFPTYCLKQNHHLVVWDNSSFIFLFLRPEAILGKDFRLVLLPKVFF